MNFNNKKGNYTSTDRTVSTYLKEINRYKILTATEEAELIERMKNGDEEARNLLIVSNLRFVYAVAKNYGNDENMSDLINQGNIGLMQALDSFDSSKGNRFLSYAIWYIRREINAYLNNDNLLIRKTNNTKTVYKLAKIKSKFFSEHNRYPNVHEMAEILEAEYGLKIKDESDLLDVTTTSISTCYDDEDSRAFENTPYFTERTAVENEYNEEMLNEHNSIISQELLSGLTEREHTVITMAYGIGYNKEYTNAEIGEEIGMSSERARQIKNAAIEKMRSLAVAEHFSI